METTLAVGATVVLWLIARSLSAWCGGHPLANPVLLAALLLAALLALSGLSPRAYGQAAAPLGWCLGPAIVALGQPLWEAARAGGGVRRALAPAILGGSLAGVLSAVGLARLFGLPPELVAASATRSVTSGVAAVTMQALGGPVPLAVALSILSGLLGAVMLPPLLARLGLGDDRATGLAVGLAAHIIGTDSLARSRPAAVPFAAMGMAGAALLVAVLLPLLARWLP